MMKNRFGMSLTNEERDIMKQLHLDKAHACLSDGDSC